MTSKLLSVVLAVFVFSLQCAKAWESAPKAGGPLGQFVDSLKTSKTAVFISSCQINDRIKAVVIFRPGATIGDFFVISDKTRNGYAFAGGMGQVGFKEGTSTVLRTNATEDRELYGRLALYLMNSPFWILPTTRLNDIFSKPTQQIC